MMMELLIILITVHLNDAYRPFDMDSYGPFYGNRDLLCNRGTRFACYCSNVTWRRFEKIDFPLCSHVFPGFEASVLDMQNCDIRLEENALSGENYDEAATFERYFKRILSILIRRECQESKDERCAKMPFNLDEEHLIFTKYQCSKDLRTSRLWLLVMGRDGDTQENEQYYVKGSHVSSILTSANVMRQLNSHLSVKKSRILNIDHAILDDKIKRNPPHAYEVVDPETNRVKKVVLNSSSATDRTIDQMYNSTISTNNEFNWVPILIGSIFVTYFVVVWILALIFCMKKRREIESKNRRLQGGANRNVDKQNRRVEFASDPPTTRKLIYEQVDRDSDYDNQ